MAGITALIVSLIPVAALLALLMAAGLARVTPL